MKTPSLALCAILLGCNGGQAPGKDVAAPGDLPAASDKLSVPDAPPDALQQGDRPVQLDLTGQDRPRPQADVAKDVAQVPDKKKPDSKPPPTCLTSWSLWSCSTGYNSCSATCGTYGMTCMQVGVTIGCTCKHGSAEKSCTSSGQGCLLCSQGLLNGCCSGI